MMSKKVDTIYIYDLKDEIDFSTSADSFARLYKIKTLYDQQNMYTKLSADTIKEV